GEAIRLIVRDVHLKADPAYLEVLQTKFRKSRLVALHATTADKLRLYANQRKRHYADGLSEAFFISEKGTHLHYAAVRRTFSSLTRLAGICTILTRPARASTGYVTHSQWSACSSGIAAVCRSMIYCQLSLSIWAMCSLPKAIGI